MVAAAQGNASEAVSVAGLSKALLGFVDKDEPVDARLAVTNNLCDGRKIVYSHLPELQQFEDTITRALHAEDAVDGKIQIDPERERPIEGEALEISLGHLQLLLTTQVVDPILKRMNGTKELEARRMLPAFADYILAMLKQTWRLSCISGQRAQQLRQTLAAQQVDFARLAQYETGPGEKARLAAAKRALKEKDWELADARRRIEHLELDRASQEQTMHKLEAAKQRESWARSEAERLLAQSHAELCSRLLTAERALCEVARALARVRDEHISMEQHRNDPLLHSDHCVADLEGQLSQTLKMLEACHQQLQDCHRSDLASDSHSNSSRHLPSSSPELHSRNEVSRSPDSVCRGQRLSLPVFPLHRDANRESFLVDTGSKDDAKGEGQGRDDVASRCKILSPRHLKVVANAVVPVPLSQTGTAPVSRTEVVNPVLIRMPPSAQTPGTPSQSARACPQSNWASQTCGRSVQNPGSPLTHSGLSARLPGARVPKQIVGSPAAVIPHRQLQLTSSATNCGVRHMLASFQASFTVGQTAGAHLVTTAVPGLAPRRRSMATPRQCTSASVLNMPLVYVAD